MRIFLVIVFSFFSISFYAQNDTISVLRHTDKSLVIPKDLKVVFRGLLNELFIEVPNAKSFEVSGNGIIKKDKNIYNLNPGAGSEAIVNIYIVLKNNKKIIEKHVFKIRNILNLVSTINKRAGVVKFNKIQLKSAIIDVNSSDKNLDLGIVVTGFTLKIPGMKAIEVLGNKIDTNLYNKISNKISKSDQITISDIRFTTKTSAHFCGISPIVVEIL